MNLREFKQKLVGSDNLDVVIVVDDAAYAIDSIEEGDTDAGTRELWIVAGEPTDY